MSASDRKSESDRESERRTANTESHGSESAVEKAKKGLFGHVRAGIDPRCSCKVQRSAVTGATWKSRVLVVVGRLIDNTATRVLSATLVRE